MNSHKSESYKSEISSVEKIERFDRVCYIVHKALINCRDEIDDIEWNDGAISAYRRIKAYLDGKDEINVD